jgi:hypothetical protein
MRLSSPLVTSARRLALAGVTLLAPAALVAQQDASLPPARQLIDKHIAAMGGKEKLLAHATSTTKGTFEIPSQGLSGQYQLYSAKPNKVSMTITIPGIGDIASGFDGSVAWSTNPMQGARVLSGKELDAMKESTGEDSEFRTPAVITSAETVEKTTMGGEACYKVKLVWKSGRTSYDCYSVATGLRVGTSAQQETQMGTIDVSTTLSDYKDFGGVKRPAKMTQEMMGMQQVMTITSVEYDTVPANAFELPKEVKALVDKK